LVDCRVTSANMREYRDVVAKQITKHFSADLALEQLTQPLTSAINSRKSGMFSPGVS